MRKIVKYLLAVGCWLCSKLYTYRMSERLKTLRDVVYTAWIRNFVGGCGDGSFFLYPCRFWGGGSNNIQIGNNTTIQSNCILGCWVRYARDDFAPSIIIGDNCNVGEHTHISSINNITIGNGLLTGRYVYIGDNSHGGLSI